MPHVAFREDEGPYAGQLLAVGLEPGEWARLSPMVHEFQMLTETP